MKLVENFGIGIDPGKKGGISLVGPEETLLYVGPIYGEGGDWLQRVSLALENIAAILTYRKNTHSKDQKIRMYMEKPPSWGGARTAAGLARRAGKIEALIWVAELDFPLEEIGWNQWPGLAGVRAGKVGAGDHRVSELISQIPGAQSYLASLPTQAGRVDCAESALIALAAFRSLS